MRALADKVIRGIIKIYRPNIQTWSKAIMNQNTGTKRQSLGNRKGEHNPATTQKDRGGDRT